MKTGTGELIPTRHSLLRRMKNWEDQASWEEFFESYWKLIYAVAIKAGLREVEAQDVVQETVMSVAKNIAGFEIGPERGSFKAWLLTNTRWRIAEQFRKRLPAAEPYAAPGDETSCTPASHRIPDRAGLDLDAIWDHEWQHNITEAALSNLRKQVAPEHYQMFDLHVLRQWPAAKVSRQLGIKMGKIYFAKYKLLRLLKKEIKRLESTPPGR
jgi:RNA polymerase sigma factor (sigma-70 family)